MVRRRSTTPTCQVLATDYPGYQRYCPYTAGPQDGTWHAPDLATALRLAREPGTTHVPVTIWNFWGKPVGAYLAWMPQVPASIERSLWPRPVYVNRAGRSLAGRALQG